ncbi:uncharacterized protein EV420DRAFT_1650599 [Desarmillaria tabescens]|uniref:Uncharacterized protein n=1 Tax=Armillaria tabescens TaxID=1929756 RepID=A0AA39JDT5_ARMTA|nr:uncharacterized protein EV420DRAFT_1650599 [Desarmillaria tabescens]KAK0440202.1 hypothetical protein EV420DRAFT_1650599 [Desarmillaria tabescens]
MTSYFLSDENGSIPYNFIICKVPKIRVYHTPLCSPEYTNPLPLIHSKPTSPGPLGNEETDRVRCIAEDSDKGSWMFDLSGNQPLELVRRKKHGIAFKSSWIAEVKLDIEDVITCINFIMAHPSFVPGVPLPRYFNTYILLSSVQSTEQARSVRSLAIIAMGELLAFINQWRVMLGSNWASNFSSAVPAFVRRVQLTKLPMRGAVFNAKDKSHGFFIRRAIKCDCPTYVLGADRPEDSNKRSPGPLDLESVKDLRPFLNDLRAADLGLQNVLRLPRAIPPLYIPPQSHVYLDIENWQPIPIPKRSWLLMRRIWEASILPYLGEDG